MGVKLRFFTPDVVNNIVEIEKEGRATGDLGEN